MKGCLPGNAESHTEVGICKYVVSAIFVVCDIC